MSFEASVKRLQEIVNSLEGQELSLEQALELFEEGISRLREAAAALGKADAAVKVLRERADGVLDATELDA